MGPDRTGADRRLSGEEGPPVKKALNEGRSGLNIRDLSTHPQKGGEHAPGGLGVLDPWPRAQSY